MGIPAALRQEPFHSQQQNGLLRRRVESTSQDCACCGRWRAQGVALSDMRRRLQREHAGRCSDAICSAPPTTLRLRHHRREDLGLDDDPLAADRLLLLALAAECDATGFGRRRQHAPRVE
jgi:hypothetical protein